MKKSHGRRKAGYAEGGIIHRVGRFFGTEKSKKIDEANRFVEEGKNLGEIATTKPTGSRRAQQIEAAEQKALGYASGGVVRKAVGPRRYR